MDLSKNFKIKDKYIAAGAETPTNNSNDITQPAAVPVQEPAPMPAATQTSAPKTKSFNIGELTKKANEVRDADVEDYNRYGISLTQQEYDIINTQIANSKDPEAEAYRYGTAIQYSKELDIPLDEAMENVDRYNDALWEGAEKTPKEWYTAVGDAFTQGKNTMEIARIGQELMEAEKTGADPAIIESIFERYKMYSEQNAALEDNTPRSWIVDALKFGAQSAPFTIETGVASLIGGLMGPGVSMGAGFAVSAVQAAGLEYMEMRAAGADPNSARVVASISGALQGVVEVALGNLPALSSLGKATGTVTKNLTGKVTANLFKRMHYSGSFKTIAQTVTHMGLEYAGEVTEEGLEEATQNIISELGKSIEAAISAEYDYDPKTIKQVATETAEAFRGGLLGSLVLAGLPIAVNTKATYKEYADIKESATNIQSEEEFKKQVKDKIASGQTHVFDGYNEKEQDTIIDNIYKNYEKERQQNFKAAEDEISNIKESVDLAEGTQEMETDEEGERVAFSGEYRTEDGRIYIENDTEGSTEDGKIKGRVLAGDPTRPHATENDGNRYGYIDYEQNNDEITITDFKMSPGRDKLAADFYEEFAEKFAGKNISWSPKFEANTKLKQQLISMNPNGTNSGLNYFDSVESVQNNRSKINLAKDFKKMMPSWNNEQIAAGVALTQAAANAKGMSLDEYKNTIFQNGQMFSTIPNIEQMQQEAGEGQKILGAAQFDKDNRAIIYVTKYSDFNTFSHEMGHIFRRNLDGQQLAEAADFYKVADVNNWTREEEEAFADGFVDYLRTGKAPTTGLKELFAKAAKFIADIIRGLQGTIPINEKIRKVYDSLLEDNGSGLSQAIKAAEKADKEKAAAEQSQKYQKEQQARQQAAAEKAENTTEDISADMKNTTENIVEDTITDPNLSTDEKSQTVVDAAGFNYTENSPLFQFAGEKSVSLIKDNELREKLQGQLQEAKVLKDRNFTEAMIQKMTGWHEAADGRWKYEVDDSLSFFKNRKELENGLKTGSLEGKAIAMADLLDAPEFFKVFPVLKNITVRFYRDSNIFRSALTASGLNVNIQQVQNLDGEFGLKGVIARRLQNFIQRIEYAEKFGIIGNSFEDLFREVTAAMQAKEAGTQFDATDLAQGIIDLKNNEGEIEARDVARRIGMNEDERRHTATINTAEGEKEFYGDKLISALFQTEPKKIEVKVDGKNNNNLLFQVAGEGLVNAVKNLDLKKRLNDLLELAQKFKNQGQTPTFIKSHTGWYEANGVWKYEVDNSSTYFKTPGALSKAISTKAIVGHTFKLGQLMEAPKLFWDIFPFKNVPVRFYEDENKFRSALTGDGISINITQVKGLEGEFGVKAMIARRLQNLIQGIEKLDEHGILKEDFEDLFREVTAAMKAREAGTQFDATELSHGILDLANDAGEIEARGVARRIGMNEDAIKTSIPITTAAAEKGYYQENYIKSLFQTEEQQKDNEYMAAVMNNDIEKAAAMVEEKAAVMGYENAIPAQAEGYKIRTKAAPRQTKKVYKTFFVNNKGQPSALFIDNAKPIPMNIWVDAKDAYHFTAENGKSYVPTVKNPNNKGANKTGVSIKIPNEEVKAELVKRGFVTEKASSVTCVAYRPGWHAGDLPFFPQGGKKVKNSNYDNIHRWNQVVFEIEIDADKDYTQEAQAQDKAYSKAGKFIPKNADLQKMPEGGFYSYTTNPTVEKQTESKGGWFISDSIKILRALSEEECNKILAENGMKPQEWEDRESGEIGSLDLSNLGYTGPEYDAARKTLAPVTYNDDGSVIPLSERFNKDKDDVLFQTEDIRNQYENTDNWMKAPNGHNSKLTEEQWMLVRTQEFKEWFGDWENDPENASKVVDENGEPQVMYHGTSYAGFDIFKPGTLGGMWFTSSRIDADSYGGNYQHKLFKPGEQINEKEVSIENYNIAGKLFFDSENDMQSFLAKFPDAEEYISQEEYQKLEDDIVMDYEGQEAENKIQDLKKVRKSSEAIEKDYLEYEKDHLYINKFGNILENYQDYSLNDLKRAAYAYDDNMSFDGIEEYESIEEKKEFVHDILTSIATDAAENDYEVNSLNVLSRAKRNSKQKLWQPINNRTYAVFLNIKNPYTVDNKGGNITNGVHNEFLKIKNNDKYDGVILQNTSVGAIKNNGDVAICKVSNQIKSATDNSGAFDETNPSILYQLIGEVGARNLDDFYNTTEKIDNLEIAKDMKARNIDAKKIKFATGWELGVDGKWKYELDTSQYEFVSEDFFAPLFNDFNKTHPETETVLKILLGEIERDEPLTQKELEMLDYRDEIIQQRKESLYGDKATVDDFIRSEELFEAYPELKNIGLKFYKEKKGTLKGEYNRYTNTINIFGVDLNDNNFLETEIPSTLVHEIQHAIQKIEGFARGGAKESILDNLADLFYEDVQESRKYSSDALKYREVHAKISAIDFIKEIRRLEKNPGRILKTGYWQGHSWAVPSKRNKADYDNYLFDRISGYILETKEAIQKSLNPNSSSNIVDELIKYDPEVLAEMRKDLMKQENKVKKNAFKYFDLKEDIDFLSRKMEENPYQAYTELAGETEARNVERRMYMSDKERRAKLLAETADVSATDQIVLFQLASDLNKTAIDPEDEAKKMMQSLIVAKIMDAQAKPDAAIEADTGWTYENETWKNTQAGKDEVIFAYADNSMYATNTDNKSLAKTVLKMFEDVDSKAAKLMQPVQQILFQKVYHGTAADFSTFSMEHLNEGEGSQSFGRGLYFTDNEDIATDYAKRQKAQKEGKGYVYTAEVPDSNLIKWDENISDETVKKVAAVYADSELKEIENSPDWTDEEKADWKNNKASLSNQIINAYNYNQAEGETFGGAELYYLLMSKAGLRTHDANAKKEIVAKWLMDAGVLGFEYPAGTKWGNGNSARNFVIFDDKDVNIVNKILFQKVDEKSLVGVHNLSEEAMRHAIKMGGLANPSMAVIDTTKNPDFSGYGEISLIAPTWLIDKKEGRNAGTFGADIYSPRYPTVEVEITDAGRKRIREIAAEVDPAVKDSVEREIQQQLENGRTNPYQSYLTIPYLIDKGIKDFYVYAKGKYSDETVQKIKDLGYTMYNRFDWQDKEKAVKVTQIYLDQNKSYQKMSEAQQKEYWEDMAEEDNPESISYNVLSRFVFGVTEQMESEGKIDSYDTFRKSIDLVKESYDEDFRKWAADILSSIPTDEKLYAGETPSGNRKYLPHTLSNVSKLMKKAGLRGGESFNYGLGSVRAMFTPKFTSLNAIKKNKTRLITTEEFKEIKEKYDPIYDEIVEMLGDKYDQDLGSARFIEAYQETKGIGLREYIESNYDIELSEEDAAKLSQFARDLEAMPTEYFETKFERPVEFNEFVGAVIPENTSEDIKEYLNSQGIIIQEYAEDQRADAIANLKDTIGQRRNILFQTEKEMLDEAATFPTWQEWKDFYSVFWEGEDQAAAPADADDEWYKSTWEQAVKISKENEYSDETVKKIISRPDTDDEDQKDLMWYAMMEEEGSLDKFLKKLSDKVLTPLWQPADAEEAEELENIERLRDRYNRELRHGYWSTGALAARPVEEGEKVPLSDRHRKTLMTLMRNAKRDYRDIYADFMGEADWAVADDEKMANKLNKRMNKTYKIASPKEDFEAMTPEQRRAFANKLDFEDLKKELKAGTMTMELESVQKLADGYDNEIKILEKKVKSLKESDTANAETIVKMNAMIDKAYEEMKTKQEAKSQAEGVRDIKLRLIKNVNRRVNFKSIAYEDGKKIIAIQTLFQPILRKFVNKFINMEGPYIRDAYSRYKTDLDYRAKMRIIAGESRSRNAKKLIDLFENKPFEKWTTEDKELAAKTLPRTNWLDQLKLDEIEKKRAGSLQLDLQSEETQKLLAETLPPDLLALLTAKDLRTWTLEEMESLVAVVNELFKTGRENFRAKQEADQLRADRIREQIKQALKSSGIQINEDDTPEEVKRKKKAIGKWQEKKLPQILGINNEVKGTLAASAQRQTFLNKVLNGYGDANIRRVARILDNGHEGINSNLLFYMENLCFNNEQRAIQKRTEKINRILKEYSITLDDLYKSMSVTFPDGTIHKFTVDELLFMEAANADDMSRAAVACGNMYDESVKELYRGTTKLQETYEQKALAAYYECLEVAATIPENVRKLLGVIQADYDTQYDAMNRVSIDEYNQPVWRVEHYVPLNRLESNGDENANRQKEDLLAASGSYAKTFGWVDRGMTNKRVEISPANQRPVQLGLYSTWTESMQRTEHFIAYAGYLRELNRVYKGRNSGAIRQLMENRYGRGMTAYIDQYINETANPNALKPKTQLDKIVRALRGKTAPAYLGWKMSGIIKQFCTSPWPFMQYVSPWKYASAAIEFATKPEIRDAIKQKSAYMNSRVYDPLVDIVNEEKQKATNKYKHGLMSFESMGMKGLELVDWCCVAPGWLAVYKDEYARLSSDKEQDKLVADARKKYEQYSDVNGWEWVDAQAENARLTEAQIIEKAVLKADDITRMCQPSSRSTDLSPIFKESNEMTKVFLQFTTSLNVIWQNIRYDLPNAVKNRQWRQVIGTIAGYVLAGMAVGLVSGGLGDEDDDPEKKAGQLAFYAMSQFTDSVPVIGGMVSNTVESTLTGEWRFNNSNNLFPISTKAAKMIKDISKEDWDKAAADFSEAIGLSLGLPVSGTKELLEVAGVGHEEGFYPEALVGRRN